MLPLDLAPEASASLLGYALRNRASGYRSQYSCLEDRRVSLNTYAREKRNLRIRFVHWSFCRICRVLPDAACRRFHATRPRPQLRKPAWLPFYTGGDASLQLVLSAFIFRLPCGQQKSITPPCESNRPPRSLRDNGRPDCAEALRD